MLDNNRKLIIDTHCEIYDQIKHRADAIFWNLAQHVEKNEFVPGAVYVIGREQIRLNPPLINSLINEHDILVVYSNPHEGSEPMEWHLRQSGCTDLMQQGKMVALVGGSINPEYQQLLFENFLGKVHDFNENIQAIKEYADLEQAIRPYQFLFLNGRMRPHRKYLLLKLQGLGLLQQSLWTNLDASDGVSAMNLPGSGNSTAYLPERFPVHYLPEQYEVNKYQKNTTAQIDQLIGKIEGKLNLFGHEWGEIYLNPKAYLDTYFSLVSETVFDYPYSFRTEKIWKPIAIGHPFIVASNRGYYRDLQNLGFKTFGHLIDESFDTIDSNQERIDRIVQVVQDLCKQDLSAFVTAAREVCKYNQQLIEELRIKTRQEFPDRFFQFLQNHQ